MFVSRFRRFPRLLCFFTMRRIAYLNTFAITRIRKASCYSCLSMSENYYRQDRYCILKTCIQYFSHLLPILALPERPVKSSTKECRNQRNIILASSHFMYRNGVDRESLHAHAAVSQDLLKVCGKMVKNQ